MIAIIILSVFGLFSMISGLFKPNRTIVLGIVILGLFAAVGSLYLDWDTNLTYFNSMFFFDNYAIAFSILLIIISALVLIFALDSIKASGIYVTEQISLVVFSLVGMIAIVSYNHLVMLFVGIEIMSIPLYILAGSRKEKLESNEAAIKYFLMGSFATGLLLMGITLIYGSTGVFHLDKLAYILDFNSQYATEPLFLIGMFLLFAGLAFKVSVFPFHFWTPDVYQGSPTWVTSFMSTAVKTAGFAALFRIFNYSLMPVVDSWALILGIIAVVTISIGSISAVFQTSVKRLLAYSSVAHAGYMLIILLSDINNTGADLLFYSLAYAISSLVAFTIIIHVENKAGSDNVDAFNGLAKVNPLLSLLLTVSLISLAGIPLTGGFFAKFNILKISYNSGFYFIVLGAIVNAIIGIYYYFKVIIAIYFKPSSDTKAQPILLGPLNLFLLVVAAILIVQLGVYPEWVYFLF